MRKFGLLFLLPICVLLVSVPPVPVAHGQDEANPSVTGEAEAAEGWPRVVEADTLTFTVHQPQLESWDGYQVEAYAAIEVKIPDIENQVYGAAFITAKTSIDKTDRMVEFGDIEVPRAVFPSLPEKTEEFLKILRDKVMPESRLIALDRFEAALAVMEAEQKIEALPLKNDPPKIILSNEPAILIYIDGDPAFRDVSETALKRAINTRPLLLKDASGKHYLHLFDGWMETDEINAPTLTRT